MADIEYRAICKECGHLERDSHASKWLDPFFLPERCNGCGARKRQYARWFEDSGWRIEAGRWERKKWWHLLPTWTPLPTD